MKKRELTFFESACIVAGNGIGGGMMAVPYLFHRLGLLPAVCILAVAWAVSALLHIMVADMLLKAENSGQILSLFERFLFRGQYRRLMTGAFFVVLVIVLFANLSAYIAGGSEIVVSLTGMPVFAARLLFYLLAAIPVFFGLKAVGIGEKAMVIAIIVVTALLTLLSCLHIRQLPALLGGGSADALGLYALAMFSLSALFSAPQAVQGLRAKPQMIGKSIALGLLINLVLMLAICISVVLTVEAVTPVAIVGWSSALGRPVQLLASFFVLLAMLTSYWAISLALSDIVREQLRLSKTVCWLVGTIPSLLLTVVSKAEFADYVQMAGGAVAIIIALLVVPTYRNAVHDGPLPILGSVGRKRGLLLAVAVCYMLMAAGSFI